MIYLDYHATTPLDPRVLAAMRPYLEVEFGNPSNTLYLSGRRAAAAVEDSREKVAALIGARPHELVFTSGATESNNLAILGVARASTERRKMVSTPIEHKSVLEPLRYLSSLGFEAVYLPVDLYGRVDLEAAQRLIDEETLLVSVQAANNEIGTLQDIAQIVAIAKAHGALVHTDAAQAVGKIPVDVETWGVDLLSISAHKLYGPKGVGALYVREGLRKAPLVPLAFGGGQEGGLRPGTLNVPGIVGLGEACALAYREMYQEADRVRRLRDRLEEGIKERIPGVKVNGELEHRLPGNSSLTFPGVEADALILNMPELALSMGSACNSGALEPSYVLTAIGLSREDASSTVRIGIGRFTQAEEVEIVVGKITEAYFHLIDLTKGAP
ncbi:cysteine desulfurase family protein [Kyrpidia sp.]|uniref:cysteine desulfurase family protein n=1 Tax=Kyrpidia sp. TaxID=2073077 RepID=UPI0025910353|nr:cysteine desulfurase family protein [Kyrpidia sp.]MCL6576923.1 cysteine desulfurase [Kyrpidia sp.]